MNAWVRRPVPADAARREFALALLAGAAGAGIVLLAVAQPWARASFAPSPPMPPSTITVTGNQLGPAPGALSLAALACLAAVLATRGVARRISGGMLAVFGVLAAVSAAASVRHGHVAATAASRAPAAVAGVGAPRLAMAAFPWWLAAAGGGALILAAGAVVAWRGPRWPGMSSKYDRPPGRAASPAAGDGPAQSRRASPGASPGATAGTTPGEPRAEIDQVSTWDALDRGKDPTVRHPRG